MPETHRKVNIIGHLHPDTDSICAAISYAYLKNQIGDATYVPRRAGALNRETQFVLSHFGFEQPQLITTVTPQIKDVELHRDPGIDPETSLFSAYDTMTQHKRDTLCVVDGNNNLQGLITVKDVAAANLDIFDVTALSSSKTRISNIVTTLLGEVVVGNPDNCLERGKVLVGTTPEMMEDAVEAGDIVLATNRYETQQFAVECGASCLIVCCGAKVSKHVCTAAERTGCVVITTPYDTYAASRLISLSIPVRAKMLDHDLVTFSINGAVDDAQKVMTKTRHRYFPVLDENGHYDGMVSSTCLLSIQRKRVILVDHNERSQAVEGLEEAEVMEIIDHHRIGSIETDGPAYFRAVPVGCTCTIIYDMFQENGIEIPANIAGLMMSAILSDTLAFRSPTCTPRDEMTARALAKICGEDIETYSTAMFEAGSDLTGRTPEEVFHQDFKVFSRGDVRFGVGQGSYMTERSRKAAESLVAPYLETAAETEGLPLVFYLFTDVPTQTSDLLCWGEGVEEVVERAFGTKLVDDYAVLPGVVSRKKQVIPPLMSTLQLLVREQG